MNEKKLDKIHQKVADALGMSKSETEVPEEEPEEQAIVPVPAAHEVAVVNNLEAPDVNTELTRMEHASRQMEHLIDLSFPVVEQNFAEGMRMPPIYKARHIEANAKFFDVVLNLVDAKHRHNVEMIKLKLELEKFEKKKDVTAPTSVTGNTFVFGTRESLIKEFEDQTKTGTVTEVPEDTDDESET